MEQEFNVLENKTIGRNLYKFRKLRDKKALEVAGYMNLSEAAYTKYERGESKITIDIVQKAAEFLNIDPIQILTSNPGYIIENIHNSQFLNGTVNTNNDKLTDLMMKLIEAQISMNEKVVALIEKNKE